MEICNYGMHTRVLTLNDPRKLGFSKDDHNFIWIFNRLVCYIGPLGPRLFKQLTAPTVLSWYRKVARDGNFPDIRTLKKEAELITDPRRIDDFLMGLYFELSKGFIKEQLLK